ncbi:fibrinogen-like protein 1 [Pseudophryne corroboree]|uniref:fibrinogen-like protein 1 n=1 Tax=Pseudophryne corroboree TaxID=495146 RepID=UPI0030820AEB
MTHLNLYSWMLLLSLYWLQATSQTLGKQKVQGSDCSDIWKRDLNSPSGIYTIKPVGAYASFQVFCEMTATGGWTMIQKHNGEDGLSFDQTWANYEKGFGSLGGEHWLGLGYIYRLTQQKRRPCTLHISLGDFAGNEAYAEYGPFSVGDGKDFYKLSAGTYSGTAGDGFRGDIGTKATNQHGSYFSSWDQPHDGCHPVCSIGSLLYQSCSSYQNSGWWFNACGTTNLNGDWHSPPNNMYWMSSLSWSTWRPYESLKFSKMYLIYN